MTRLQKSENKSRNINSAKSLRLSSIDGWTSDKLPKLLIVWDLEKVSADAFPSMTKPGKYSKKRDIEAVVDGYKMYLITDEDNCVVPWEFEISHTDLVGLNWTQEWHKKLKEVAEKLNKKYSLRPINFQLSFKNGAHLRLQYQTSNYTKLPKCPVDVSEVLSPHLDTLLGVKFRLKKDHTSNGGTSGWYDNEMAMWEHHNSMKSPGILHIKWPGMDWRPYPAFKEGKQDYWTGFAIEFLIARELPHFADLGGHATGFDHVLDLTKKLESLGESHHLRHGFVIDEAKKFARELGKHEILRLIQNELIITPRDSDTSSGSTVTKSALMRILTEICSERGIDLFGTRSKKTCIEALLRLTGGVSDDDDVSNGGTITSYALLKILLGLRKQKTV